MILLPSQLLSLLYMVFAGWFYALCYAFYKRLLRVILQYKITVFLEMIIQIFLMYIVYRGLYKINYGQQNLYLWIAFFVGIFLYIYFYSLIFLSAFEVFMSFLRFLFKPINIAYLKFSVIIKKQRKRRREKRWKKTLNLHKKIAKRKN